MIVKTERAGCFRIETRVISTKKKRKFYLLVLERSWEINTLRTVNRVIDPNNNENSRYRTSWKYSNRKKLEEHLTLILLNL